MRELLGDVLRILERIKLDDFNECCECGQYKGNGCTLECPRAALIRRVWEAIEALPETTKEH